MASSKEMQQTSRPLVHRPSLSSTSIAGSTPARQSHSRTNSHSVAAGSLNANHRVSRRKSITNSSANMAAVAAVLEEGGGQVAALPIAGSSRRNTMSKNGVSRSAIVGSLPSPPASLPAHKFLNMDGKFEHQDSAIDDELNDVSGDEGEGPSGKARVRRASDGQPLTKEGRKSNRVELRCEKCGKGYKHGSCLTKHLWEHTPEWSYTSKLLISKHQQVQLLEAASVLVAMNADPATTPPDSARDFISDQESLSPFVSGSSSEQLDGRSSADTTPPPQLEGFGGMNMPYRSQAKRYSSGSGFSRSYQSVPSIGSLAGSVTSGSGFGHYRQQSQDMRPPSSGLNATGEDDHELTSRMLGWGIGTSNDARAFLLDGAPPVPPVPLQFLDQNSFISSFPSRAPESNTRGDRFRPGVKMDESDKMDQSDDDDDHRSRARSDEDDQGVFGEMAL